MMRRHSISLACTFVLAAILCANVAGWPLEPQRVIEIHFQRNRLAVYDGALGFRGPYLRPAKGGDRLISTASQVFRYSVKHLQVVVLQDESGKNPIHDAQDGAYLTADYSTDPPQVKLTKKPENFSQWELVYTEQRVSGAHAYIRNVNDRAKEAWLYWAENGPIVALDSNVFRLHAPILSSEKKIEFDVSPYVPGGDGK